MWLNSLKNVFVLIIKEIYDLEDTENIKKKHLFWNTDIDTVSVCIQILKA